MSLRIRLRRVGRKKQPSYRIVVANSAAPRDGAYVDDVGFYNPRLQPAELRLNIEKVEAWVAKGATLSTTAASLLRKAKKGGDAKVGYKVPGAPEPEPEAVVEAPVKPKRAPRKPAAAGSTGTGAPAAAAAAPAAEATAAPAAEATAAPAAEATAAPEAEPEAAPAESAPAEEAAAE